MYRLSFSRPRSRRNVRQGTALLEIALCVAVLAPLAVMGLDYAYAMYRLEEVRLAVQEASLWSATARLDKGEFEFAARVRRVAAYGSAEGKTPRLQGVAPENFRVEVRKRDGKIVAVRVAAQGIRLVWPGGGRVLQNAPSAEMPRAR